jgi:2-alkyl-3-oxoalkanoate reductase
MRVFVTGATGALGRYLVPGLVMAGHEVTATTRTPGKVAQLRAAGAEPVVVDGLDREAVIAAVQAAVPEVIVHEMTALASLRSLRNPDKVFAVTNELRTRAHMPAAITYVDETVPLGAAEGIVLRYGTFYGPGAGEFLVEMARKRQLPVIGGGTGVWSFIEITDASAATIAAIEHGTPGIYNVVDDDPAPVAEWLPYLAMVAGGKPPRRVPAWIGRLLAGEFVVAQMTSSRGSSNNKARKELGWVPQYLSWREGFRALGR